MTPSPIWTSASTATPDPVAQLGRLIDLWRKRAGTAPAAPTRGARADGGAKRQRRRTVPTAMGTPRRLTATRRTACALRTRCCACASRLVSFRGGCIRHKRLQRAKMTLKVHNTLTRRTGGIRTARGPVSSGMYVCGPTVYGDAAHRARQVLRLVRRPGALSALPRIPGEIHPEYHRRRASHGQRRRPARTRSRSAPRRSASTRWSWSRSTRARISRTWTR